MFANDILLFAIMVITFCRTHVEDAFTSHVVTTYSASILINYCNQGSLTITNIYTYICI